MTFELIFLNSFEDILRAEEAEGLPPPTGGGLHPFTRGVNHCLHRFFNT